MDGGVKRSTLAWPHPHVFVKTPQAGTNQKQSRNIKTTEYVTAIVPGLLWLLIEVDNVWGKDLRLTGLYVASLAPGGWGESGLFFSARAWEGLVLNP